MRRRTRRSVTARSRINWAGRKRRQERRAIPKRSRAALPSIYRAGEGKLADAAYQAGLLAGGKADAEEGEGEGDVLLYESPLQRAFSDWCAAHVKKRPDIRTMIRLSKSYTGGYAKASGRKDTRIPLPLARTAAAVVCASNEQDTLGKVLQQLERLPFQEVIVVLNGCRDQSYTAARNHRIASILHVPGRLGHDVGRSMGAAMTSADIVLFTDGDVVISAEELAPFIYKVDEGIDAALNDLNPYLPPYMHQDEVTRCKSFLNRNLQPVIMCRTKGKWREADRLVGFCLLLHRDVLHRIGYLDEGYRIGNYEDDDWIIRLRLTGRKLFIAGDSFIHHFGSVSMKQLGQQFESVHHHNESYYTNKWDNPYAWVTNMKEGALARFPGLRSGHDFYPSHVLVRDQSGLVYFLLNGRKYALSGGAGQVGTEAVLLSRLDIRQIPDGEYSLTSEQIREMLDSAAMDESLSAGEAGAGQLVEGPGGRVYQWSRGTLRPFASLHTLERWHMALRKRSVWPLERLNSVPEGDLIIAPPHLDNPVL
ncbi:glycosyltransferase family 2 protein [Paenibacillus sp. AR247]|uniref:glycosyltransferase family 2 protein n=1 Tax=Paenibacillus sp. AR247 TaxID=1631599 RepID=UPI000CFA57C2|nr:glycosyltransferase [Paenibacillus sp. AR247]PQP85668.1 hypothetical protein CPT76_34255 [Paenibacillus sp. AR247]